MNTLAPHVRISLVTPSRSRLSSRLYSVLSLVVANLMLIPPAYANRNTRYHQLNENCNPTRQTDRASRTQLPEGTEFVLNPDSLRERLLRNNLSILLEANAVHQAKTRVSVARGKLLPSINLGTLLLSAVHPTFALSTVEFLLPFLIPANWFSYFQSKHLVQAEKIAFRLLKLNTYASAYSLYYDVMSDRELQSVLKRGVDSLKEIEKYVEGQVASGMAPMEDWERSKAQRALAEIDLSKVNDLVHQETATVRHLLAADLVHQFKFDYIELPPSPVEEMDLAQAVRVAKDVSLELDQMVWLRKSAKLERWKKVFGFTSSSSLSANQGVSGFSFSNLSGGFGFNFGFDYFPSITLAQYHVKEIELRAEEIHYELTKLLEISLRQLDEAQSRVDLAAEAELNAQNVFQAKKSQYELGVDTLFSVLESRSLLQTAQVEALRARVQRNHLRVALHRALLTDQFDKIEGCRVQ